MAAGKEVIGIEVIVTEVEIVTMIVIMTVGIETGIGIEIVIVIVITTVIGIETERKTVMYMIETEIETGTEIETETIIAGIGAVIESEKDMVIVIGGGVVLGAVESGVTVKETEGLARCLPIVSEGMHLC